ncbi:hypothetical protein [Streptomyces shenzhenensis]|nr:hypothetical protein [Streptomyces shenzhenensis]
MTVLVTRRQDVFEQRVAALEGGAAPPGHPPAHSDQRCTAWPRSSATWSS